MQAMGEDCDATSQNVTDMEEPEHEAEHEDEKDAPQEISHSEDDEEDQKHLHRHDWDTIRKIPDLKFKQLVLSVINVPNLDTLTVDDCQITARFDGGYNHVVFLSVEVQTDRAQHFVVRVPAIGTTSRWQEGDAYNLCYEMALLIYLRENVPRIPIPDVVAFEDKLDTMIGAPFCVMRQLPGKPAHCIWFEDSKNRNFINAGSITAETEVKRCTMLRSLAHTMAELRTLTFDRIGMPNLVVPQVVGSKLEVTHSYRWKAPYEMTQADLESDGQVYQYGPFDSSKEYMTAKLESAWSCAPDPELEDDPDTQNVVRGIRKILDMIYAQPTVASSKIDPNDGAEDESFVLRHPDLDFQNILVDDEGKITGIIDWEGCMAVPRCAGYASVPDFLRRDWERDFTLRDSPSISWELDHYRQIYADAMQEIGAPEAKYTLKSVMYRAVVDGLNEGSVLDLIPKLFAEIPGLRRTDVDEIEQFIGEGWPKGEEYLKDALEKLFEPVSMTES
jgi:hypothetical protein